MLHRLVEEWRKGKKEWESRSRIHSKLSKLISSSPTPCKSLSLSLVNNTRKSFFFFFFFRWNLIVVFVESGWSLWKFWLIDISCLLYSGLAADFFESSGSIDQTVYTNLPWSCIKVSRWVIQSGYFVWISVVWWGLLACWCQNESWDFAFTRAL